MTLVGRRELDHPALGTTGGAGLHTSIETIYTNVGDDLTGRFKAYSGVANSAVTNIKHNFGVAFEELDIVVYTGTFPNLTVATNYTVAVDGGNPKTHINVTAPGSGGPHTFAVQINHSSQTLKNKVLQTANVDQYLDFDEESAPATPAANKVRMYAKADGKFYKKDDTGVEQVIGGGSGAGGINYLVSSSKAWDFEDGLSTGWSTYADAAAVSPVDGTGGTANVTFAASSSSPLRGAFSGLFTKDAANRQGEGVSVDFTLDNQDTGKPFTLNIDCSASAAYTGSSGTEYARVYVYDVTNAALLPGYIDIAPGSSTCKGFFLATTSTSYRLIFHVAGTGTSAWTLKVDNVTPGQQSLGFGGTTSDWQTYTPTGSFTTNTTYTGRWRRVGDTMEGQVYISFSGAPNAVTLTDIQIPSGYTIDTAKLTNTGTDTNWVGGGEMLGNAGATAYPIFAGYRSTTSIRPFLSNATATYDTAAAITNNAPTTLGASDSIQVTFRVPIVGWSSNIIAGDRAAEQYASNSGTWDASDTTSFAYGLLATQTAGALTSDRVKRVRFQTPHSPTSKFRVLFSQDGKAFFSSEEFFHSSNGALIKAYDSTGSSSLGSGVYLQRVSGSDTDVDVVFFRYYNIANDDSPITNWPTNVYWTVERVDGGALVGFPVGARNVVGDTTGTTVPAGYIGEYIESVNSTGLAVSNGVYQDLVSVTLTPGTWDLCFTGQLTNGGSNTFAVYGISTVSGNSSSGLIVGDNAFEIYAPGGSSGTSLGAAAIHWRRNVTTTTTYYAKVFTNSGATGNHKGKLFARRAG